MKSNQPLFFAALIVSLSFISVWINAPSVYLGSSVIALASLTFYRQHLIDYFILRINVEYIVALFLLLGILLFSDETAYIANYRFLLLFIASTIIGITWGQLAEFDSKTFVRLFTALTLFFSIWSIIYLKSTDISQFVQVNAAGDLSRSPKNAIVIAGIFRYTNAIMDFIPFAGLSLGLIPLVFLKGFEKLEASSLILSALLATYVTVSFVTRAPFLILTVSALTFIFVVVLASYRISKIKLFIGFLFVAVIIFLEQKNGHFDLIIGRIFESSDVSNGRLDIWSEAIYAILQNPLGGGRQDLVHSKWAHNGLLDILLDYGLLVGFLLVLLECIVLYKLFYTLMNNRNLNNHALAILSLFHFSCLGFWLIQPHTSPSVVWYFASVFALSAYIKPTEKVRESVAVDSSALNHH